MGRANVYLPDDLERRVKAARIPISEICQQALQAAVDAAEAAQPRLGEAVADLYRRGAQAGQGWARAASALSLLALVRDQRLDQIPTDHLPPSWYSLSQDLSTAWEAGFLDAARTVARQALTTALASTGGPTLTPSPSASASEAVDDPTRGSSPGSAPGRPSESASETAQGAATAARSAGGAGERLDPTPPDPTAPSDVTPPPEVVQGSEPAQDPEPEPEPGSGSRVLGDASSSYIGVDHAGRRVAFDPHAAVRQDKSPLFAVLGPADQRARLVLSIGQDTACRGGAVMMLDLSGQLATRARGLGKIVRFPVAGSQPMPTLESLLGSAGGVRGVWDVLQGLSGAGGGLFAAPGASSPQDLLTPGYVTVVTLSGDGGLGAVRGAVNALRALADLTTKATHPRLLIVDLPTHVAVPGQLAAALDRFVRTARRNDVAVGLSADSATALADVGGTGALLSTVFAFPTSSPAEAARLRDLLGAHAPILLNPPGFTPHSEDEVWVTMRDLTGRLGQVHLDPT